jgi:hypothetical protein
MRSTTAARSMTAGSAGANGAGASDRTRWRGPASR